MAGPARAQPGPLPCYCLLLLLCTDPHMHGPVWKYWVRSRAADRASTWLAWESRGKGAAGVGGHHNPTLVHTPLPWTTVTKGIF